MRDSGTLRSWILLAIEGQKTQATTSAAPTKDALAFGVRADANDPGVRRIISFPALRAAKLPTWCVAARSSKDKAENNEERQSRANRPHSDAEGGLRLTDLQGGLVNSDAGRRLELDGRGHQGIRHDLWNGKKPDLTTRTFRRRRPIENVARVTSRHSCAREREPAGRNTLSAGKNFHRGLQCAASGSPDSKPELLVLARGPFESIGCLRVERSFDHERRRFSNARRKGSQQCEVNERRRESLHGVFSVRLTVDSHPR